MSKKVQPKYLVEANGPDVNDIDAQNLLNQRRYKYLLVNVLARRARDLNRGGRAYVEMPQPHTLAELATEEVRTGKMDLVRKKSSKVLVSLIKDE